MSAFKSKAAALAALAQLGPIPRPRAGRELRLVQERATIARWVGQGYTADQIWSGYQIAGYPEVTRYVVAMIMRAAQSKARLRELYPDRRRPSGEVAP